LYPLKVHRVENGVVIGASDPLFDPPIANSNIGVKLFVRSMNPAYTFAFDLYLFMTSEIFVEAQNDPWIDPIYIGANPSPIPTIVS
jgi:hypothetical protein